MRMRSPQKPYHLDSPKDKEMFFGGRGAAIVDKSVYIRPSKVKVSEIDQKSPFRVMSPTRALRISIYFECLTYGIF